VNRELADEIEKVMNLHLACIAFLIGFVLPANSSSLQEFKIAGLSVEGGSLAEILLVGPDSWTPKAKVKTIVGIGLGLQFGYSFGLIHGDLTATSIF
jgi:hypothetical protein